MTLTDMRRVLARHDIHLTKSLGQNFLHDSNQLRRIIELAELQSDDGVLEIGPGLGPLTEQLLATGAKVLALEKDARLVAILRERFAEQVMREGPLELRLADALEVVKQRRNWAGWKLVANLPYSVASPILVELALAEEPPTRMVTTLQWEVAERLMAQAGDDDYGLLSLLVQLRFEPKAHFRIPASCFFPAPDVESACVRLDRRVVDLLPVEQHRAFCRIVKRAFSQRRKMMMKLLRTDWPADALQRAFAAAELQGGTRAEAVRLEQFIRLTKALASPSPA